MARDREKKTGTPGIAAAVSAALRTAMRRARGDEEPPRAEAPARPPDPGRPLDLAEERAASRDLLAIDSVVRRFYSLVAESSDDAGWDRFRALFQEGARIGTGRPDPASSTGLDDVPIDRFIEVERAMATPSRCAERSRTVHVLGQLAVIISAFEVDHGPRGTNRGVNVLQLRLSPERGWLIQSVLVTGVERAITEKSADPRPLSSRRS